MRQCRLRYGQTSNQNQQTANIVSGVKGQTKRPVVFEYYVLEMSKFQSHRVGGEEHTSDRNAALFNIYSVIYSQHSLSW